MLIAPSLRAPLLAALLALAPAGPAPAAAPPASFQAELPASWRLREQDARGLRADAPGRHGPGRLTVESRPSLETPAQALESVAEAYERAGFRRGARNALRVAGRPALSLELFGAEGKVPTRRGLVALSDAHRLVLVQWSIPEGDLAALKPGVDRAIATLRLPPADPERSRAAALNAIVQENVDAVARAIEAYAADHDGRPPAPGRCFALLQAGGYWAPALARANPWANNVRQPEALGVAGTPLAPATRPPSPLGATLGPGRAPSDGRFTPATFGAILYDADPASRELVLYGIGEEDGRAVVVHASAHGRLH